MSTGDRPNFPLANQRLDKVDVEAISDLIGENIMRTVGALLGPCGGLLSDVTTTYDGTGGTLTIGACRLGYAGLASGSSNSYDGGVIRWDPTYSTGNGVVTVSSLGTTAGSSGYIFFKKSELETDEENRAYYDSLAQEKKVGVGNTRVRETALFAVSSSYTGFAVADGWHPFLYLAWDSTGGSPTIYRISVFDSFGSVGSQRLNAQLARSRSSSTGYGVPWSQGHIGFSRMLREIIGGLQHAYDNDFTLNADGSIATNVSDLAYRWAGYGLTRGLKQLDADLTTAETDITTIQSDISTLQSNLTSTDNRAARTPVLYAQTVNAANDITSQSSYIVTLPSSTNERTSTGVWRIDFVGDSFGCSETINPCAPIVSLNDAGTGQISWRWHSEYVLEIVTRQYSLGTFSNYNYGFSLIIVKGG